MVTEKKQVGLKKMRKNQTTDKPNYKCDNCHCMRYSPCTCMKKWKEEKK